MTLPGANIVGGKRLKGTRQNEDFYPTPPHATEALLKKETFKGSVWEPACGEGHMSEVLKDHGYVVFSSDVIDRGYGKKIDFLTSTRNDENIITNPPFKHALAFVEHSLNLVPKGGKIALLLKLSFLEGQKRKDFYLNHPPARIYVFSKRLSFYKNEIKENANGGTTAYSWFVWEKGNQKPTTIDWI